MPDVFISYSTVDEEAARFFKRHLEQEGVSVFVAATSLQPGQGWSKEILGALKSAEVVLFLASRSACSSVWVQQEMGFAIATNKKLIPIVWDISPTELPGWTQQFQALNIAGATIEQVRAQMGHIAAKIKANKNMALLIAGVSTACLVYLALRK